MNKKDRLFTEEMDLWAKFKKAMRMALHYQTKSREQSKELESLNQELERLRHLVLRGTLEDIKSERIALYTAELVYRENK